MESHLDSTPHSEYRHRVLRALELAMEKGVHFCVFPEYSISAAWITEIRDKIHQQASPQSIFCLPLEHIPLKNLTQVLLEAGVKETNPYLVEFPLDRKEGILNLCWILAKGEDGALCSHFQAKLYPALAQEEPRLNKFQGGQVLRVFTTDNEKPLTFAILVCFDFIAGGHGRPSPVATLQDDLTRHRRYLDWLLVPQFNPKPAHPEFERVLDQFYQHHHCRATVVAGVNVTGGFDHPLRARGPFGGSSLVGRLSPTFKSRITFGRLVAAGGGQVQLYIIAEEDLLVLYADRFPTTRAMSTIGEGRKYRLQFYYHFAPDTGGLEQWTLIKNPQTPPWAPGFYRKHCDFFRGLVYRFERELQHHLTRSLPHPVPYVDLILEQGEIPPELPPRLEQERKKQLPHHVEREEGIELPRQTERKKEWRPLPRDLRRRWKPFRGDLLDGQDKFLLVGEMGTGKTTLLFWLAREIALRGKRLPFYLNLRDLGRSLSYEILSRKFRNYCAPLVSASRRPLLFEELVDTGGLVFLMDGLDQMAVDDYVRVIQELLPLVKQNALILATRPTPARYLENRQDLTFLRLMPFDVPAQRTYFGAAYDDALALTFRAPDLAAVPMLAYLVRELLTTGLAPRFKTHTGLYEAFLDHVFERENRLTLQRKANRVRRTMKALAFYSLGADEPQFGYVDYAVYDEHNEGRVQEKDILGFGLVNALVERGTGAKPRLFFTHQSFQEFLAAQYAWEKPEAKNQVIGEMWQPRWREVLKFLVGLDESGEMLRAIYPGPDMDNVLYSRLFLAAQCLSEDIRGETAFSREVLDGLMDLAVKPPFISQAVTALIRLDIPSNRKRLIQLLANQRFLLLEILNQGPPLIQKIVYLLEPFLKDENPSIRFKVAAIILDILKNMPRGWVPAMAQGLEAEDVPISESAIVDLTQHLEDKE